MANDLAKNTQALGAIFKSRMGSIKAVSASHMSPERLYRIVLACVTRTPALQRCTIESIFRASLQAAELGLEPGSATGDAYLVPYGDQCQLIPGYRGLIALAMRSGHVAKVEARVVYQGDVFLQEYGLTPVLKHVPNYEGSRDPKDITYAYCLIWLTSGEVLVDVMTRVDIERIRSKSKAANSGPWVEHYAEMCRKTVARRALKYAPMSVEMKKAVAIDDAADTGDTSLLAEFESFDVEEPEPLPTKTERLNERIRGVDTETSEVEQGALV